MRSLAIALCLAGALAQADTLVIAHRGASAYLPEHTLEAVAAAHAMGADYIEQDVVLTADDVPIVLHDITLDSTTNVATVYPDRAREDGHYYAIDFTLAEIRTLLAGERRGDDGMAAFARRFPHRERMFRVPTLEEELRLIQGLNQSTGRDVGIYVELKQPGFHRAAGRELGASVLQLLYAFGYRDRDDRAYLQCFDADTLRFLNQHTDLRLVQLLSDRDLSAARAAEIAAYADGVGPSVGYLRLSPGFVSQAQAAGLEVHPYTFRADLLPAGFARFEDLLRYFVKDLGVDGVFTDHPDLARRLIGR